MEGWRRPKKFSFAGGLVEGALVVMYFALAFQLALPDTAQEYFLIYRMRASPADISAYYATTFIPWSLKLVFGFVSDALPIGGLNRTPYLAFYSFLAFASFLLLGLVTMTLSQLTAAAFLLQSCLCGCEVVLDSVVVERVRFERRQGDVQSLCQLWRNGGSLAAGAASALLLQYSGLPYQRYWVLCALPAVIVLAMLPLLPSDARAALWKDAATPLLDDATACARESPPAATALTRPRSASEVYRRAYAFIASVLRSLLRGSDGGGPPLWPALLFLFVLQAAPSSSVLVSVYYIAHLRLAPAVTSLITCTRLFAGVLGALLYRRYFRGTSLWRTFVSTSLLLCVSSMTQLLLVTDAYKALHVPVAVLVGIDSFVVGLCSAVAFMPVIVMAAAMCPPGLEATLYAAVLSTLDGATSASDYLGSAVARLLGITQTQWSALWVAVVLCAALRLLPLLLFYPWRRTLEAMAGSGAAARPSFGYAGVVPHSPPEAAVEEARS